MLILPIWTQHTHLNLYILHCCWITTFPNGAGFYMCAGNLIYSSLLYIVQMEHSFDDADCMKEKGVKLGENFHIFLFWQTDGRTDLNALTNLSSSIGKFLLSLALVVLEKKSFTRTRTRTRTPQSHEIMSADWQVSWHKN